MKEYNFKINGNDYTVGIEILNDTEADVIVNGASYSVEVLDTTDRKSTRLNSSHDRQSRMPSSA